VTLLAALYTVTGPSFVAGKLVSWLALVAMVLMCAMLARRVYSVAAGWTAALVCATSPAMRGYVGTLQYEVLTGTMLLAVLLLAEAVTRGRGGAVVYWRAILTGLVAGLLILTRETFLIVTPLVAAWMASRARVHVGTRCAFIAAALLMVTALVPATIWSAVQSLRHGTLITISEKGPMVVAFGNNPLANGTYNAPLVGVGEPTGLAYVREAPGRSLVLAGRKALYFWGVLRDGWNVPRPAALWMWRATTGLVPFDWLAAVARGGWLMVLFFVAWWWLGRDGWRQWWILPVSVVTVMGVHIATLSSHRFAVPTLPVVFVLISGPLGAAARAMMPSLRAPMVAGAVMLVAAIVVAMQFQAWPLAHTYRATALEGIAADNLLDGVSGRPARFAAAGRGERPVLLLPDEYLPSGSLTVAVTLRRTGPATSDATPVARVALVELDGRIACTHELTASEVATDRFTAVAIPCRLSKDTAATLAVHSLGTVDFAVDEVRFAWNTVSFD
jgi:4-amino-4-deoxy-L-arabinose transferase-like glycosyltransferase